MRFCLFPLGLCIDTTDTVESVCLQTGLWIRGVLLPAGGTAVFYPGFGSSPGHSAGQKLPLKDDDLALMNTSRREAGTYKCHCKYIWPRRAQLLVFTLANKSINHIHDKKIYIHLKGQACLKQTAGDICKNVIIYVLNIFEARGCPETNVHSVSHTGLSLY